MKTASVVLASLLATLSWSADAGVDDANLARFATCQDSWLDWKNDEARMTRFAQVFETQYVRDDQGASFTPKASTSVMGFGVSEVYPQSAGMALGFSLVVNAPFAQARAAFEKQLGKPMKCETTEGTRACEVALGAKKTAILMANQDPSSKTTLLGCYYYYQQ